MGLLHALDGGDVLLHESRRSRSGVAGTTSRVLSPVKASIVDWARCERVSCKSAVREGVVGERDKDWRFTKMAASGHRTVDLEVGVDGEVVRWVSEACFRGEVGFRVGRPGRRRG